MTQHQIVSEAEWLEARKRLLMKEKEFTKLRDKLSRERRALPWERVEKAYLFDGPTGKQTLAELFDGRSQLIVYHFMFAPDSESPCRSCSFWADNFDGILPHLNQRDVSFAAISRAPLDRLRAFAKRVGWSFNWLSSGDGDFNYDYRVSFRPGDRAKGVVTYNFADRRTSMADLPGISVFAKDAGGAVYHTYSCYARGLDMLNAAYHYLDLTPKGRDEEGLPYTMSWVRYRDQYGT